MGRTRTWDRDAVVRDASAVFHRKGYASTSVRDLEHATGLHPGSVYAAFGSKDGLFVDVLDRYRRDVVEARVARYLTRARDPRAGVRALFRSTFEGRPAPDPGCLLTNSAIESPTLPVAAQTAVDHTLDVLRAGFRDAALRVSSDARRAARTADQLLALYQGLLVLVRAGAEPSRLRAVCDAAVVLLDEPIRRQ